MKPFLFVLLWLRLSCRERIPEPLAIADDAFRKIKQGQGKIETNRFTPDQRIKVWYP